MRLKRMALVAALGLGALGLAACETATPYQPLVTGHMTSGGFTDHVLAVSHEQFIVFSSNAFAILGLRALYFLLAGMHARFAYLQQGLAVILAFVGVKMILSRWVHIETWISLLVIVVVLGVAVLASLQAERRHDVVGYRDEPPPPFQER